MHDIVESLRRKATLKLLTRKDEKTFVSEVLIVVRGLRIATLRLWLTAVKCGQRMMRYEVSNLDETQGSNRPLSEPHFDDEATLLSARRVVPFHKLAYKTKSKRNLLFAAILTATLMMGLVGGVIYARLERIQAPKAETTESATPSVAQDDFISSSVQHEELANTRDESKAPVNKDDPKPVDKRLNSSTSARKEVSVNPSPTRRVQSEPDDWDSLGNEREIRRAERRAARRARREAAREAQRSDDLFRIQEIFEGSSRP